MAGDDRQQMLAEAYRRNLLPPDMKSAYEEAQKRGIVDKLPSSEPDFGTNFLGGLTAPVRGVAQMAKEIIPGAKTEQLSGEGTKKEAKVKSPEADPDSAGYFFGSIMGPAGAEAGVERAAARFGPRIITPFTKDLPGRLAKGATIGGIVGATQPVENPEQDFWEQKSKQAAEGFVLGYGFTLGGEAVSAGVGGLGRWLAQRNIPVEDKAVAAILQRIEQGHKYGAASAQDMLDIMTASDKPLVLADMPSPNLRSLAGRVTRSPGESRAQATQFMTERDKGPAGTPLDKMQDVGASGRLSDDIAKYVYSGPSMRQTAQGLYESRSAAARPAYEAVDKLQNIWSPRLQQFLENPDVAKGMAVGYRLERNLSLAQNRPFDPTMMGVDLDEQGNIKLLRTPNMRVLDMAKQGLDAMIEENRDAVTGRLNKIGYNLEQVRQAYLKELDGLDKDGVYKKARAVWAGPSASIDALKFGRTAFARSAEENAEGLAKLSDGDKQFALIGFGDQLREKLLKSGFNSDESKQLLNSPWMAMQIKPFFKTKNDYEAFVKAVTDERTMAETNRKFLGGSETAERVAEDKSPLMQGLKLGKSLLEGRYYGSARDLWQLHRDLKAKPDPELDSAIAKMVFAPNIFQTAQGQKLLQGMPQPVQHYLTGTAAPTLRDVIAPAAAASGGAMVPSGSGYDQQPPQSPADGTRQAAQ